MNHLVKLTGICIPAILTASLASGLQSPPTGPYLGQRPPGEEFVRFAPGIVPDGMMTGVTVSPDGKEIYWATRDGIYVTRLEDGQWTTPAVASFSGISKSAFYDEAPVISPDNRTMFFSSRRPYGSYRGSDWRYWRVERTEAGWAEPQPLPEIINSRFGGHFQLSVADSGTLYFANILNDQSVIYYSRLVDGAYTEPEPLEEINSFGHVFCPFVAPDESYIIFNVYDESLNFSEGYYISFRGEEGQWLKPQLLCRNSSRIGSFVTRDGKYIFCIQTWASAEIIEKLRPKADEESASEKRAAP
ncbi:MAG: PD40 domain-containing protein [Phycisphaerales bacterium]|nr:MAG: PD40 domain-containing protein [Phycisphaerales bacterium]